MIIDCDSCAMQQTSACDDCVVSFLLDSGSLVELGASEIGALDELARAGLVAPLRLVPRRRGPSGGGAAQAGHTGGG